VRLFRPLGKIGGLLPLYSLITRYLASQGRFPIVAFLEVLI
jgi:hypothetical protein